MEGALATSTFWGWITSFFVSPPEKLRVNPRRINLEYQRYAYVDHTGVQLNEPGTSIRSEPLSLHSRRKRS